MLGFALFLISYLSEAKTPGATEQLLFSDSGGDTINWEYGIVDATAIYGQTDGNILYLRVEFSQDTDMSKVRGFIDIDNDFNFYTGMRTHATDLIPGSRQHLGVDFYLDLTHFPEVKIINASTRDVVGNVIGVFKGQAIEVTLPLELVSQQYHLNGYLNVSATFANENAPTDAAPDVGNGTLRGTADVTITPSSSRMVPSYTFDLLFVFSRTREEIESIKITLVKETVVGLETKDVTYILSYGVLGVFPDSKHLTLRIPGFQLAYITNVDKDTLRCTIFIELKTPRGIAREGVVYTILHNCEECFQRP